jgi:hypothetical protein
MGLSMSRVQLVRAVLAFLTGGLLGIGGSSVAMLIYNQVLVWTGREPVTITWASVLPLGILVGVSMAINMTNHLFGD